MKACKSLSILNSSKFTKLKKSYFTEKIIGMHFKYHTQICEYDGWRPPIHEPILVIGFQLNGFYDPLDFSLRNRIDLYRKFYPDEKYKLDCSCATETFDIYSNDPIWIRDSLN